MRIRRRSWPCVAAFPLLCGSLCSCVPWTVRSIEDQAQTQPSGQQPVEPAAYVESIWSARLVPTIFESAVEARILLDAFADPPHRFGRAGPGGAPCFLVKGQGRVLGLEAGSRNRLILVDIPPLDQRADLSIQVGPVLRGTSLRDATGLVQFSEFVNQLQFAEVANLLNERVLNSVLATLDFASLEGSTISFAGAFSADSPGTLPINGVVPVLLAVHPERP